MGEPTEKLQHRIDRLEEAIQDVGDTQFDAFRESNLTKLIELNHKLTGIIVAVQQELS